MFTITREGQYFFFLHFVNKSFVINRDWSWIALPFLGGGGAGEGGRGLVKGKISCLTIGRF